MRGPALILFVLCVVFLPATSLSADQGTDPRTIAGPTRGMPRSGVGQEPAAAPKWVAWRVAYDVLNLFGTTSVVRGQPRILPRLGLSEVDAQVLKEAGAIFLADMARIDAEARAHVDKLFGVDPPPELRRAPSRQAGQSPSGRPLRLPRGTRSVREALEKTGQGAYLREIEARKQSLLTSHLAVLRDRLNPLAFTSIQTWVDTTVAPSIVVKDRGARVGSPLDRSTVGEEFITRRSQ